MTEASSKFAPVRDLRIAMMFLTRLPVGWISNLGPASLANAAWAFPAVGVVIGGLAGGALYFAAETHLHPFACAVIALAVQALITGALHEDGLGDVADGLGGHSKEKTLEIMRDSRIGSFGVLALVFGVGLKVTTLGSVPGPGMAWAALIAAAAFSRAVLPAAMYFLPTARTDGRAHEAGKPTLLGVILALGIGIAMLMVALPGMVWLMAIMTALPLAALLLYWASRKLGGQTGDVLGALQQLTEVAVLVAAAAWSLDYL